MESVPDQPGAFIIEVVTDPAGDRRAWLTYNCPCGCGSPGQLRLVSPINTAHDSHTWGWDGNRERPTLAPSIRRTVGCRFHGHLKAGVWSAEPDGAQLSASCWRPA